MEPATIFPALQFFNVLSGAISHVPPQLSNMLDARVAVGEDFWHHTSGLLIFRSLEYFTGGETIRQSRRSELTRTG